MKKLFSLVLVLFVTVSMFSQQQSERQGKERIEMQVRQYITSFSLNETDAEQFSALYKAYCKELYGILRQYQKERPQEGQPLTDEQIEKRILDNFAQSRAILDVREKYYKEFRTLLSPSQINTIFEDEKLRRSQIRKGK